MTSTRIRKTASTVCLDCGVKLTSRTRPVGVLGSELCSYCNNAAELENSHADGHVEEGETHEGCYECGTYDAKAYWGPVTRTSGNGGAGHKGQPRPCGCGCKQVTSGGIWMPGHDSRWAGETGRWAVANYASDPEATIRKMAPAGTTEALIAKATRIATNAKVRTAR